MKTDAQAPPPAEEMGPQAAAAHVIEVDAVPDDGGPAGAGPQPFDARAEWRRTVILGLKIPTDLLAAKLPFWRLSDEELNTMADAWSPLLAEWFPDAIPQWLVAAGATAVIFGPRVLVTHELLKEERRREKSGASSPGGPRPSAPVRESAPREPNTAYPDRDDPQPATR